jgi:hypothetical protein
MAAVGSTTDAQVCLPQHQSHSNAAHKACTMCSSFKTAMLVANVCFADFICAAAS